MGITLSLWLQGKSAGSPPSSSSAFPPLAVPISSRLAIILNSSPVPPGDRRSRWSSVHRSPHFLLSACKEEVTRAPTEQSSDGVRAELGVMCGLHVWEVCWSPIQRGTHAVVGVSTQNCPLQAVGYNVLVGRNSQSWGWELKSNHLWHDGQSLGLYPGEGRRSCSEGTLDLRPQSHTSSSIPKDAQMSQTPLPIPERILLVLDADAGTLGYVVDGSFLGIAFKDLPCGVELFPAVSSVRGGANIRLCYLNGATRDPPALMALCGLSIRQLLGQQGHVQTQKLPLPPVLQNYLMSNIPSDKDVPTTAKCSSFAKD
ncbi:SPRY domain-containing SOCS box protein 1 [Thalassophryne amazonica]|uniref:SPRY domain-containing SOCS box protein 1 n=1 Tax=Thalassophryne amazonica TaxID=390379 RepID=UPI001471785B|nr:SPRY domain-containing SOCS box protein 1 [Thalassophryne amazonica]XP_034030732.1 SPRY domain-containing SOCS box protein 1 [Thalassophryne amazonica]